MILTSAWQAEAVAMTLCQGTFALEVRLSKMTRGDLAATKAEHNISQCHMDTLISSDPYLQPASKKHTSTHRYHTSQQAQYIRVHRAMISRITNSTQKPRPRH